MSGGGEATLNALVQSITGNRDPQRHFLKLPVEIRRHIYEYLLPTTVALRSQAGVAYVWLQGNTAFLATCQQVYSEGTELFCRNAVFVVEVGYDTVIFRYRRLLDSGLLPQATPPFLEVFGPATLRRIRNVAISVNHVDSYTGESCHFQRGAKL